MKNPNIVEVKLHKKHIDEHIWLSNSEDSVPRELTIVFDHSRLIPARQYLDTDPLIKGVLLPADMLVNEDAEIEVEDEQIWVMRGKELRAEFTDGLTGTVYSVSFEYEKSVRFDNRLLISASVKELLQIQNRLLTPLAESPYPEWPEYAERGYCYMIDFERISPIPVNLSEEQKSPWCLENWGVAGNAEETLINCLLTIDPSLSPEAEDFLDIYFETETVPLPVIRKLIAEHPKLEVEYYYYDQLAQSAGQVIVYGNGQCKEEHFTGIKECRISELGHQFGYEY